MRQFVTFFKLKMLILVGSCILVGCNNPSTAARTAEAEPPTVMPIFQVEDPSSAFATPASESPFSAAPTVAFVFSNQRVPTFTPTPTAVPSSTPVPARSASTNNTADDQDDYQEVVVFADRLASNWSLENSQSMTFNVTDNTHTAEVLDEQQGLNTGTAVISVTPEDAWGSLYFTVRSDTSVSYPRSSVAAVRFWLNSGNGNVDTDDLAVAVIGSNAQPHWTANDTSVFPDSDESFSETRLYYLGVNRVVPPDTWVEVEIWLDNLIYDPEYAYVTGFYIKNDAEYNSTFYVDQVSLILFPEEE